MLISLYHSLPLRAQASVRSLPSSSGWRVCVRTWREEGGACIACEQRTFPSREEEGCETAVALISRLHTLFKWQQLVPLARKYAIKLCRCSILLHKSTIEMRTPGHSNNYNERHAVCTHNHMFIIYKSTYVSFLWREFNRSIKG